MKRIFFVACILAMLFSICGCRCFESVKPEGFAEKRQIGNETDSVIGAGLVFRF